MFLYARQEVGVFLYGLEWNQLTHKRKIVHVITLHIKVRNSIRKLRKEIGLKLKLVQIIIIHLKANIYLGNPA